jgi:hypothetical protein
MVSLTSGVETFQDEAPSGNARPNPPADAASADRRERFAVKLGYTPFPKQQEFHASPAKYRLFGGAAGPGKSKALLMEAILQAHETPGSNTLLLRRTFPELEQTLLHYFRRDVPRELYKNFYESKHLVEWTNGSTTRFGYCQSEHDVYQYQGSEFLFIGIDELTMFTLRQWQFLTSRNRCPIPGAFPCMAAATNPGNIGHSWVKALWVDKQPAPGMENPAEYDPADYDFIPARYTDNPLYAGDESYLKTLRALPSHLRRAFLDGSWDVFAGQYFDNFDCSRHVVRAEQIGATLREKSWWPRWISMDWGFEHPSAVYWHASIPAAALAAPPSSAAEIATIEPAPGSLVGQGFSPDITDRREAPSSLPEAHFPSRPHERTMGSGPAQPQSRVVTYREYVTRRTPPRELAREIIARSLLSSTAAPNSSGPAREKIDAIYLSPDAFARRTDEASIAEQMGDVFAAAGFPRPVPADDDRVGGWMLMYQMLSEGGWLLTENCIELIRTLPNLVRDQARVEDVEKMDGDDPADAARYGLKSRYGARYGSGPSDRRMPLADRLAARVVSADPTIRAMQARKALLEETSGAKPVPFAHHRRRFR